MSRRSIRAPFVVGRRWWSSRRSHAQLHLAMHTAKRYSGCEAGFIRCRTPDPVCIPIKRSSATGFGSIGNSFPKSILLNSRGLGVSHRQPPLSTFLLHLVLRGGHSNRCREAHYLFSWTSDESTNPRLGGYSWGPPHGQGGEFGTKVRVFVLASSPDSPSRH